MVTCFVSDRGKVVGGLPDVVTIMEKKVCVGRCDSDFLPPYIYKLVPEEVFFFVSLL